MPKIYLAKPSDDNRKRQPNLSSVPHENKVKTKKIQTAKKGLIVLLITLIASFLLDFFIGYYLPYVLYRFLSIFMLALALLGIYLLLSSLLVLLN